MTRTSRIGRHLPTSGGLKKTLKRAEELGLETIQVFVSNPQGWADPVSRPDAENFVEDCRGLGLSPIVVHSKYLINLASPDEEIRRRSVRALAAELAAAAELGADLVVVHSGSHGGDGEEKGLARLVSGLDEARKLAEESSERAAEPVVENSVGAGTQLCWAFGSLGEVSRRAGVRVCLDTAHAFVAGYDLSTPEGARQVAQELKDAVGSAVVLLHLNDARNTLGSHRDGHRRIGEGQVRKEAWEVLFHELSGVPAVMETPYGTPEVDLEQIRLLKELAGGLPMSAGKR